MKSYSDIDSYIQDYPKDVQVLLKQMRATIKKLIPRSEEAIKYGLPTFILNEHNVVHFGGFKKHIGFFPTPSGVTAFKKELAGYKTSKGAIQFPIDIPLPLSLIKKIVQFRVKEVSAKK
jgi:uncharacterized protein YdhG (YjbR/CyaY superfamily)